MIATGIPLHSLHHVWHDLWPMLEPAVKRMKDSPNVLARLIAYDAQLWAVYKNGKPVAAIVTQITTSDDRKRCLVWLIGGSRASEWMGDFLPKLEAWARSLDCIALWASGRDGWARLLKKHGCETRPRIDGIATWERAI